VRNYSVAFDKAAFLSSVALGETGVVSFGPDNAGSNHHHVSVPCGPGMPSCSRVGDREGGAQNGKQYLPDRGSHWCGVVGQKLKFEPLSNFSFERNGR